MARYTGNHCPVCEQAFTDEDDIVVCPDCGTPYHRACWQKTGACMHQSEHAAGFEWHPEFGPEAEAAAHAAVCPNCGTHNQPGSARCAHCGVPLPSAQDQPAGQPEDSRPIYARGGESGGAYPPPTGPQRNAPRMETYGAAPDGHAYRREVGPDDAIDGIKARDWAAFVGRSPVYYLMHFFRMSETKQRVTFSFSAFFFGPAYLFYRKLWKEGIVTAVLMLFFTLISTLDLIAYYDADFFGTLPIGWLPYASTICYVGSWALRVLLGLFAVSWYQKRAKARIQNIYAHCPEGEARTDALLQAGGVSVPAVVIYFVVSLVFELALLYLSGPTFLGLMYDLGW